MKRRRPLAVLALTLPFPSAAAATTTVAQWNMDDTFGTTMTDGFRKRKRRNHVQYRDVRRWLHF